MKFGTDGKENSITPLPLISEKSWCVGESHTVLSCWNEELTRRWEGFFRFLSQQNRLMRRVKKCRRSLALSSSTVYWHIIVMTLKIPVFYTVFQAMQRGRKRDNLPSHLTVSKCQGSVIRYLTITLPFRVSLRLLLKGSPGDHLSRISYYFYARLITL